MKKSLCVLFLVFAVSLAAVSLCSAADFTNYAGPQLEWISNTFPMLWDQPRDQVLWIMNIFPDYECIDYGDRVCCSSRTNNGKDNNIYITYFTDDYEEKHDNLWKVSVSVDIQNAEQAQTAMAALWLKGMKPSAWEDSPYEYPNVQPLFFTNDTTELVVYAQEFLEGNNAFFLMEYFQLGSYR